MRPRAVDAAHFEVDATMARGEHDRGVVTSFQMADQGLRLSLT